MVSIKNLAKDALEGEFEYPELKDFKVKLRLLSNTKLQNIIKDSTKTQMNKKTMKLEEVFDNDKFVETFTKETVVGWSGLKASYLPELMPADISGVENPDEEYLDFDEENALMLMKASSEFDRWVNSITSELGNFNKPLSKKSQSALKDG